MELEITDTGVGIPPEAQQKIFSLFYTTKPGGNGVGLAVVFRVVQLHNGAIDYTSEVNRGTTFRITLATNVQQDVPQAESCRDLQVSAPNFLFKETTSFL